MFPVTYDDTRLSEIYEKIMEKTIPVISAPKGMELDSAVVTNFVFLVCRSGRTVSTARYSAPIRRRFRRERELMLIESLVKATVELQGFRVVSVTGGTAGLGAIVKSW